jgi:hypothetical protein
VAEGTGIGCSVAGGVNVGPGVWMRSGITEILGITGVDVEVDCDINPQAGSSSIRNRAAIRRE